MRKTFTKFQSALLIGCMLATAAGCTGASTDSQSGSTGGNSQPTGESGQAGNAASELKLDFFSVNANYQGVQSGWYGSILEKKFNIKLNILAPNVAGGGDALYQTRSAAGNIGDLVSLPYDKMRDAVKAGLILDLSPYIEKTKYLKDYLKASQTFSKDWSVDGVFAFPTNASTDSPLKAAQVKANAVEQSTYLRWDYYYKLGAPKIENMDHLLDVLKQMQDQNPKTDSGKKTYSFSLFPDWDGNGMSNANFIVHFLGYQAGTGFIDSTVDGGEMYDKMDEKGPYYKVLKWYFDANRKGLVDPDSPSQNFDAVNAKVADGSVLFTWFPMTDYNTPEHLAQGKGQIFVPVGDMKYGTLGHSIYGQGGTLAIGSKVKDPQRVVDFLDWMASPENAELVFAGPKGLTWEEQNGKPVLTEFGKTAQMGEKANTPVPAEYGGGTYRDGSPRYVAYIPYGMATNPNYGEPYEASMWSSTLTESRTLVNEQWTKTFGYDWPLQYVEAKHQIAVLPGTSWRAPADSSDIATQRSELQKLLRDTSWRMIFASDEKQFESLWKEMKTKAEGLGYEDILAVDRKNAEAMKKALLEAAQAAASK